MNSARQADAILELVNGHYKRGTLAPDYVHLLRADIIRFLEALEPKGEEYGNIFDRAKANYPSA